MNWTNLITDRLSGRIESVDAALSLRQNGGEEVILKSYAPTGLAVYADTLQGLGAGTSIQGGRKEMSRWHEEFKKLGLNLKVYVGGKRIATLGGKKSRLNVLNAIYAQLFRRK